MKKYLAIAILIVLTGCNQTQMKYGQGGKNACLFVKEQVPELREDISSVEVIGEDSMICDIGLMFGFNRVHEAEMMYYDSIQVSQVPNLPVLIDKFRQND